MQRATKNINNGLNLALQFNAKTRVKISALIRRYFLKLGSMSAAGKAGITASAKAFQNIILELEKNKLRLLYPGLSLWPKYNSCFCLGNFGKR
jgi:hypothetical protein